MVGLVGLQESGERLDQAEHCGDLRAGGGELVEALLLSGGEPVRPAQKEAGRHGGVRAAALVLGAALVQVPGQQVRTALVAQLTGLAEELLNRDLGSAARRLRRCSRYGSTRVGRYGGTRWRRSGAGVQVDDGG